MTPERTEETHIYIPRSMARETMIALVNLVNDVYDVAEENMWKETGVRTNLSEIESLIQEGRLMVVERDIKIIGLVKLSKIDKDTGELGMLVVDPSARRQNLGRRLVESAEAWAKGEGFHTMQLQLLTPRTWKHPTKELLKEWYSRMGYTAQCSASFEEDYPDLVNLLACECDLTTWTKPI
ncbi:hypothetical protein FisN_13Hh176 [Fistulifera solaris]|uniref:N-acetyltransferase domain-containing protein n=1 Tax=Fistulifera solaris TaxID=1519565 RepID=A0A1Z5KN60_FISSO|nr:hypothetical protein FisN_13Hh176 [Fistulifera solaris]|eukprot:GAX27726.1 hypothetical protein FisN_13Hh176 [Fistulifera solaris]